MNSYNSLLIILFLTLAACDNGKTTTAVNSVQSFGENKKLTIAIDGEVRHSVDLITYCKEISENQCKSFGEEIKITDANREVHFYSNGASGLAKSSQENFTAAQKTSNNEPIEAKLDIRANEYLNFISSREAKNLGSCKSSRYFAAVKNQTERGSRVNLYIKRFFSASDDKIVLMRINLKNISTSKLVEEQTFSVGEKGSDGPVLNVLPNDLSSKFSEVCKKAMVDAIDGDFKDQYASKDLDSRYHYEFNPQLFKGLSTGNLAQFCHLEIIRGGQL